MHSAAPAPTIEAMEVPRLVSLRFYKPSGDDLVSAGRRLGFALSAPLKVEETGTKLVLWVGPAEWLLVGHDVAEVKARLAKARSLLWHCADVSDGYQLLSVAGTGARALLGKGCSLDLHEREFPAGDCAGTVLAQIDVLLHKISEDRYHIYCDRSWAGHVHEWLIDAVIAGDEVVTA